MKDDCILNSSVQQPSPAIPSSSPTGEFEEEEEDPGKDYELDIGLALEAAEAEGDFPPLTPTQRPSSSSSSNVPTVKSNDDTSSVTTEGPTADASMPPTDDVSERNAFYDLRFCFHSQFLLIDFSLNTTRFLHLGMMITMGMMTVLQNQPIYQPYHPLLQQQIASKLKSLTINIQMKHPGSYIE